MAADPILDVLKVDLGFAKDTYDDRLTQIIAYARRQIEAEGITLSADDSQLIIMYSAWLWRKRDSGEEMPRMLRYALNNRLFGEKMHG